jgi:hypothetical protein
LDVIYLGPSATSRKGETLLRMNICNAVTAFASLVLLLMLVCANSYAGGAEQGYGKFCRDNNDFDYFSHATCVTCMNQGDPPACFCKNLGLQGEEYGDCVSGAGASKLSFEVFGALLIGGVGFKLRRRMITRAV